MAKAFRLVGLDDVDLGHRQTRTVRQLADQADKLRRRALVDLPARCACAGRPCRRSNRRRRSSPPPGRAAITSPPWPAQQEAGAHHQGGSSPPAASRCGKKPFMAVLDLPHGPAGRSPKRRARRPGEEMGGRRRGAKVWTGSASRAISQGHEHQGQDHPPDLRRPAPRRPDSAGTDAALPDASPADASRVEGTPAEARRGAPGDLPGRPEPVEQPPGEIGGSDPAGADPLWRLGSRRALHGFLIRRRTGNRPAGRTAAGRSQPPLRRT